MEITKTFLLEKKKNCRHGKLKEITASFLRLQRNNIQIYNENKNVRKSSR